MVMLLLQGWIYMVWDAMLLRHIYPLVLHLPLILTLYGLTGKLLWSSISVLTAYLCCQLRRWIALLVVALVEGGPFLQNLVELIITVPLLLLLLRFVSPTVCLLGERSRRLQVQFGLIPVLYYIFDYATRVYTDQLSGGAPVVVEFMPFVCCCAYLVFLLYYVIEGQKVERAAPGTEAAGSAAQAVHTGNQRAAGITDAGTPVSARPAAPSAICVRLYRERTGCTGAGVYFRHL